MSNKPVLIRTSPNGRVHLGRERWDKPGEIAPACYPRATKIKSGVEIVEPGTYANRDRCMQVACFSATRSM